MPKLKAEKEKDIKQSIWDELYQYVRCDVMGYDQNQSLSKQMVLRLKGLSQNKFMANNKIPSTANYPFDTVLDTFKFCKSSIEKAVRDICFRDEQHKFNYILKIVENNLNTVYIRKKRQATTEYDVKHLSVVADASKGAEYQTKTDSSSNANFDDLW